MKQKKSKNIFWVFSILAVVFLVLFSFAVGASNVPMMILTFILDLLQRKNIEKTIGYKLYRQ